MRRTKSKESRKAEKHRSREKQKSKKQRSRILGEADKQKSRNARSKEAGKSRKAKNREPEIQEKNPKQRNKSPRIAIPFFPLYLTWTLDTQWFSAVMVLSFIK